MSKEFINPSTHFSSDRAYSKAIKFDIGDSKILFIAGQISKNETGEVVGLGDYTKQTEYIFEKLGMILEEAGMGLNDLVKVNIYVTDMREFDKVSIVRDKFLRDSKPVSTAVAVNGTVTNGCDVEIDGIAIKKK